MSIEKERKAFEDWYDKAYLNTDIGYLMHNGQYSSRRKQHSWDAWQASANREGYKLMLVEPTQEMIDKAVCDTPETPSQDYWHSGQPISDDQAIACYKSMIGATE